MLQSETNIFKNSTLPFSSKQFQKEKKRKLEKETTEFKTANYLNIFHFNYCTNFDRA